MNDYSKYLQGKYSYMNMGTTSMQGVPITVSVLGAFLKKCMNDPEKAKYLEENLAALTDCASYAVSHARGTLTSISYEIDANGNITGISSGTNDPDGKIARENAERKAKEKRHRGNYYLMSGDALGLSEQERQDKAAFGLEAVKYLAENYLDEGHAADFMSAMRRLQSTA